MWKFSGLRLEVVGIKLLSLFLSTFLLLSGCLRLCRLQSGGASLCTVLCHTLSSLSSSSVLEKRWHSHWCIMQDLCIVMAVLIYLFVGGVSLAHLGLKLQTACSACVSVQIKIWVADSTPTPNPPPPPPTSLYCYHAIIPCFPFAGLFKHLSHKTNCIYLLTQWSWELETQMNHHVHFYKSLISWKHLYTCCYFPLQHRKLLKKKCSSPPAESLTWQRSPLQAVGVGLNGFNRQSVLWHIVPPTVNGFKSSSPLIKSPNWCRAAALIMGVLQRGGDSCRLHKRKRAVGLSDQSWAGCVKVHSLHQGF